MRDALVALCLLIVSIPASAKPPSKAQLAAAGKPYGLRLEGSGPNGASYSVDKTSVTIIVPAGFHLVPAPKSHQVAADFSIKADTAPYEVRFRFDPMTNDPKKVAECAVQNLKDAGSCIMADLDAKSDAWARTFRANLSGGEDGTLKFFPDDAVSREFGADWGLTSDVFALRDADFAGPYKIAQFTQVHRNGVGTYTLIHVADTLDTHEALIMGVFHLVRFAPKEQKSDEQRPSAPGPASKPK